MSVAYSIPKGKIEREQVDVSPIRAFLEPDAMLPIRGDDPLHASRRTIFSAAEVRERGAVAGYLYVVLQGEPYRSTLEHIAASHTSRIVVGSFVLLGMFGLGVGLLLFRAITRRITELDRDMAGFLAASQARSTPGLVVPDELSRLRATFEERSCSRGSR